MALVHLYAWQPISNLSEQYKFLKNVGEALSPSQSAFYLATELEQGVFWPLQSNAQSRDSLHAAVAMLDTVPAPLDLLFGIAG